MIRLPTSLPPRSLILAPSHLLTFTLCVLASPIFAQAPASTPAPVPASQPGAVVPFQPGIRIDWANRQVEVDAKVILREGLLELFACSPRTREHESIVVIQARPLHVFHALGLIGLEPGHPIRYDPQTRRVEPARGDAVEIDVRCEVDGKTATVPIETWMREKGADRPLERQPWRFAGSVPLPDRDAIEADGEGTVIALVDFESALIALPEQHSSSNDELWLEPRTEAIPPVGTACVLLMRAGPMRLGLDAAGRLRLNDQPRTLGEAARAVREALAANPKLNLELKIDAGCPESDRARLDQMLSRLGVPAEQIRSITPASAPASTQPGGDASRWLRKQLAATQPANLLRRQGMEATGRLADDLGQRAAHVRRRTETIEHCVDGLIADLAHLFGQTAPSDRPPPAAH